MIPSLLVILLALSAAAAEEVSGEGAKATPNAEAQPKKEDTSLERYRTPLDAMMERTIGTASRAVRFDWRTKGLGVGVLGGRLLELNGFNSARLGGFVRVPFGGVMGELAVSRVFTWGSDSTQKLALTPYRQLGRPSRFELDLNVGYPLAEGVATARLGWLPATELVFSANAGVRYLYYYGGLEGADGVREKAKALFAPQLSQRELDLLEGDRPPGMQVDGARYNLLAGLALDVYFHSGGFLAPRVMAAVPLTGSGLGWWWDVSLAMGWLF